MVKKKKKEKEKAPNIKAGTLQRLTDAGREDAHPNNVPKKRSTAKYHRNAHGVAEPPGQPRLVRRETSGNRTVPVARQDGANHVGRRLSTFLHN